jgi:hypothetical protein
VLLLLTAVGRVVSNEPTNIESGVLLPVRIVETNVLRGQRVRISSQSTGDQYFFLQYSNTSFPDDWHTLTANFIVLNKGFLDLDGSPGRLYRAVNGYGPAPTLTIDVFGGKEEPSNLSIAAQFFSTWQYFLESRPSSSSNSAWTTLATSTTNANFIVQREVQTEYRIRAVPPVKREDYEPILIAGQSNALLNDDQSWGEKVEDVLYLSDYVERYVEFLHPARFHGIAFSFSVQAATELSDNSTRRYLLIPVAVGGTALKQWFPTNSRFDVLSLFGRANYRRVLGSPKAPAAIWYYGHESSSVPLEDYIPDWKRLIAEYRKECGPAPVLYAQLAKNSNPLSHEVTRLAADRQRLTEEGANEAVASSHMVVAFDLPLTDGLHLSAEGQRLLGRRFALAMREHVYREAVNGTGPRLADVARSQNSPNLILVTFNKQVNEAINAYENEFRVKTSTGEVPIRSVRRAQNAAQIEVEITRNIEDDLFVEYGVQPSKGNNVYLTNVVRDVDGLPAPVFGPILVRRP